MDSMEDLKSQRNINGQCLKGIYWLLWEKWESALLSILSKPTYFLEFDKKFNEDARPYQRLEFVQDHLLDLLSFLKIDVIDLKVTERRENTPQIHALLSKVDSAKIESLWPISPVLSSIVKDLQQLMKNELNLTWSFLDQLAK